MGNVYAVLVQRACSIVAALMQHASSMQAALQHAFHSIPHAPGLSFLHYLLQHNLE